MRLLRLLAEFSGTVWALDERTLEAMAALLAREPRDAEFQAFAEAKGAGAGAPKSAGMRENVAVIPVHGVIAHRAYMVSDICGPSGTSSEALQRSIEAAIADPSVRSIVLDINSPGGDVFGTQEVANAIFAARDKKPIAAVANAQASSAAYWIGSAAHELFVTPSGMVGSIGVFMAHTDTSKADEAQGKVTTIIKAGKYKAEGEGPLTDAAKEHFQSVVDGYYTTFVRAVAKNRSVAVDTVRNGYGQGRTVPADAALEAKMVDGIATLDQVISKYARRTTEGANSRLTRALEAEVAIAAEASALR